MDDSSKAQLETEIRSQEIEIWKTVVSTQMHFNDLELRIRNFAILLLAAIVALCGTLLASEPHSIPDVRIKVSDSTKFEIPVVSLVLYLGTIIWLCFWFMDRHWYHRLLMGAVLQGMKIEERYRDLVPAIDLSSSIKEKSPSDFMGKQFRSHNRLDSFYGVIAFVLVASAGALVDLVWLLNSGIAFAVFSTLYIANLKPSPTD